MIKQTVLLALAALCMTSSACSVNSDCDLDNDECCLVTKVDDVSYYACGIPPIDSSEDLYGDEDDRLLHTVTVDCVEIDFEAASQVLACASLVAATL